MPNKQKAQDTLSEGVVWVSSTGGFWKETDVTVEKLKKYSSNIYGDGVAIKQRNLIFPGKLEIKVLNDQNEKDPDLTTRVQQISKDTKLNARIQQAWYDTFWYGLGIFNPVFQWVENEYLLTEIRHLPAWSFYQIPSKQYSACNPLLQGVILTKDGEIEYWQIQSDSSGTPVQVRNIFTVQDPVISDLGGKPTVQSCVPVLGMLDYLWNAQMQRGRRVGSPLLFIRITDPKTSAQRAGKLSDVEYAKLFLRKWGKDTGFTLRDNMELVDPHITDKADNLETINALNQMITEHFSPSSWIATSESRLGGSDTAGFDLMTAYVSGIHTWLEEGFEALFQPWLDESGYIGYHVDITLPLLQQDKTSQNIQKVEKGKDDLTLNERRVLLGHAPADDATRAELEAEKATRTPSVFGNVTDPDLGKADSIISKYTADIEDLTNSYAKRIISLAKQGKTTNEITLESEKFKQDLLADEEKKVALYMEKALEAGDRLAGQYLEELWPNT